MARRRQKNMHAGIIKYLRERGVVSTRQVYDHMIETYKWTFSINSVSQLLNSNPMVERVNKGNGSLTTTWRLKE